MSIHGFIPARVPQEHEQPVRRVGAAASTTPPPAARTGVPADTAMSMPGCDSATSPGRT